MTTDVKNPWELESGLPNDVDAWMVNSRFAKNDKYTQNLTVTDDVTVGLQFISDLVDKDGTVLGTVGYSVGTGWTPSDDGKEMTNPARKNVVRGTRYGDFQERVIVQLKQDMSKFGVPTKAATWDGMGFHWMLEKKKTVGGDSKDTLMPTIFLDRREIKAAEGSSTTSTAPVNIPQALTDKLLVIAKSVKSAKDFQLKVMNVPEALGIPALMAQILDDSAAGYWANHNK
jgi:hypothetical protein